jgi:hypothetical protein
VDDPRDRYQFDRIKLHQEIERAREIIAQYETGLAHYRQEIENYMYTLGWLDERLGDGS